MTIANENKRLPVTLTPTQQADLARLAKKYHRSQATILRVAFEALVAQEDAGFVLPKLVK